MRLVLLLLLIASASAEPQSPRASAVIRYSTASTTRYPKGRRLEAHELMKKACAGAYDVEAEGRNVKNGRVLRDTSLTVAERALAPMWSVQFACASGKPPALLPNLPRAEMVDSVPDARVPVRRRVTPVYLLL